MRNIYGNHWYEVTFNDGRTIRREYVTKKLAESMFTAMEFEMVRLEVKSVSWGVMQ